jgi:tetratricopeptide (TPR) repeat protein
MTTESTNTSPSAAPRRKGSLIATIAVVVAVACTLAWLLSADFSQRWLASRRTSADLEQAVRHAPDSPWPFYELGIRYARQGRLPDAIKLFERARQAAPDSADIRLALGRAYIYNGDPKSAVPELQKACELDAGSAPAHRYLATALRLLHDKVDALAAAKKATELDPKNADGWYQYGVLYTAEEGDENTGRPLLKKAVDLNPTDGVYNFAYGRSLADGSQFADAIPYLRRAVKDLPADANVHFFLGLCLHRSGKSAADLSEAADELRRAVQLAPSDYKAHFELGNVLEEAGKFAEALPEFELSAKLNPSLGEIWFHLSRMADRAGKHDEAVNARAHLAEIRKYHLDFTTLVHQLQLSPNDSSLQLRVGMVLEKQNKPLQAAAQYADVIKRQPNNTEAQALLENLRRRMHWPALPADSSSGDPR